MKLLKKLLLPKVSLQLAPKKDRTWYEYTPSGKIDIYAGLVRSHYYDNACANYALVLGPVLLSVYWE